VSNTQRGMTYGRQHAAHHHRQNRPYTYQSCNVVSFIELLHVSPLWIAVRRSRRGGGAMGLVGAHSPPPLGNALPIVNNEGGNFFCVLER